MDSILTPFCFHVLRDSLVLVENAAPDPFYLGIYNLETQKKIAEFGRRGKGPGEMLSARFVSNASNFSDLKEISIFDVVKKRALEYNIDSLIQLQDTYEPRHVDFPDGVFHYSKLDSTNYVCYNSYYLRDRKFHNDVERLFVFNSGSGKPKEFDWDFFTLNVSKGYVLISPQDDRILVPHFYEDKLDVYDKNLNLLKTIAGPDKIELQYRLQYGNHVSFAKNKKSFMGYFPCCHTNKYVYLIYRGLNGDRWDDNYTIPVEVFKLDWNGNLISRYQLDRYIYRISVSRDEKYLYGSTHNSIGENSLVKYTIN
jgi:hypothetical protein